MWNGHVKLLWCAKISRGDFKEGAELGAESLWRFAELIMIEDQHRVATESGDVELKIVVISASAQMEEQRLIACYHAFGFGFNRFEERKGFLAVAAGMEIL